MMNSTYVIVYNSRRLVFVGIVSLVFAVRARNLDVSYNSLSGTLPSEFADLNVALLDTTSNQLEGPLVHSIPKFVTCVVWIGQLSK